MRLTLTFLFFVLFLTSCGKVDSFAWLEGNWVRINDQENRETFENWEVKNGVYTGVGFTMSDGDTISQELMTIQRSEELWNLKVKVASEPEVKFNLTSQTPNSFTFENQEIDFPKVINYVLEGDTLKAVVSNDEMSIDFIFVRQ
ncbi:DUF6265 family protein [uncultured Arcticibacterium sp.]|uniref:DUF6265 family protein n=1 Tax=uncultured Arcticibacterium sp. TaxID=2173042 RepID=UPI0030F6D0D3